MKLKSIDEIVKGTCIKYDPKTIEELKSTVNTKTKSSDEKTTLDKDRAAHLVETEGRASKTSKERVLGLNDMVDLNYLVRGIQTCKSVCRIIIRDDGFREIGYGTGFKVSPNLVLTNHHVLDSAEVAQLAIIEFDFELDQSGNPKPTTRFALSPSDFYMSDRRLDYALIAIKPVAIFGDGELEDYGFLRLNSSTGKIKPGEYATIIQHPSGQVKQVALRENELLKIDETTLLYQSDTAPGSSGSPVLNDSWQVVGLHHSGLPRTDADGNWLLKNGEVADQFADDADIDWIANEGIRASRIVNHVLATVNQANESGTTKGRLLTEFQEASDGTIAKPIVDIQLGKSRSPIMQSKAMVNSPQKRVVGNNAPAPNYNATNVNRPNAVDIPITLSFSMGHVQVNPSNPVAVNGLGGNGETNGQDTSINHTDHAIAIEKNVEPFHERDYSNRTGYDPNFLGTKVSMPKTINKRNLSKTEDGSTVLNYEHFSIINNKKRKMAIFTASNVDASQAAKRPEEGKTYSRVALSGLGKNDREKWFIDPRIPAEDQLSDEFYNKDRRSFDKGHIVQRNEVAWGSSYKEVRRANGDTYHITNCSPQVSNFNRSNLKGDWGKLENNIMKQAKREKYCVFSGPVLLKSDPLFKGVNQREGIEVQIPTAYWKIVTSVNEQGELESFAFLLAQDLTRTSFEFDVSEEWKAFMISIEELEELTINIKFPSEIKKADQYFTLRGEDVKTASELHDYQEWSLYV